MGRTFENRKLAMAKRSDRDAKAFSRAGRQIAIAVRGGGGNPDTNPALRRAIQNARGVNMPKDRINNAIEKALGLSDTAGYETIVYEGYGPHGIALMVETATDNPTRTVANVRFAFKKGKGNLGNSGAVSFLFDELGVFRIAPASVGELAREELELELIDHGLEDLVDGETEDGDAVWELRCARDEFGNLAAALEERKIEPVSSGLEWVPKSLTELDAEQADEVLALIVRLEEDDDVQNVFHNLA